MTRVYPCRTVPSADLIAFMLSAVERPSGRSGIPWSAGATSSGSCTEEACSCWTIP